MASCSWRALHSLLLLTVCCYVCCEDAPRISLIDKAEAIAAADSDSSGASAPGGGAMQDLLNWAIQHSDPERLKELMAKYQENNLTIKDVYGQDVIDAMFVNEGSVMKDMTTQIADFANVSVTDDDLESALVTLMELVEQVDNAGNLHRMGGLKPLLQLGCLSSLPEEVSRGEPVRTQALWTLGVAAQNNAPVQEDLMDIGGLQMLLGRLPLCSTAASKPEEQAGSEYCAKLLFAISSLVKNNQTIQTAADAEGLFDWLLDVGVSHPKLGVAKKAMALLDIALSQTPNLQVLSRLPAKEDVLGAALLAHIHSPQASLDTDAAEKSLRLVNRLLSLRPMLFPPSFRSQFTEAVASAAKDCESMHGAGDELCTGLTGLAQHSSLALAARDLPDDEL